MLQQYSHKNMSFDLADFSTNVNKATACEKCESMVRIELNFF